MKFISAIFTILLVVGCAKMEKSADISTFLISNLDPTDVLIVYTQSEHWGLVQQMLKFSDGTVHDFKGHSVELTPEERGVLDAYLVRNAPSSDWTNCSSQVDMKLVLVTKADQRREFLLTDKDCDWLDDEISFEAIGQHFADGDEEPSWRRYEEIQLLPIDE